MAKILLLEDDEVLSESLIELLEDEGFTITHVKNGEEAVDKTFIEKYDLFLFDVNVPLLDGFELLKNLRESGDKTPTIFITALNDIASLSKGFDVGADDYIKKPFDFDELLIRIQALLKKQYNTYQNEIKVKNFRFDIEKNELYKDDEFISLPPYELKLIHLFFKNLDKTLTKEQIVEELYYDKEMSLGALRVHINRLRKIGLPITTVKGIGYRLASS
ncbi:MAG: response regulator transcription factor [Epsilonproteobacteria bacterium]|nr:response regulator transcription factor [Campylobacterota bacterium]